MLRGASAVGCGLCRCSTQCARPKWRSTSATRWVEFVFMTNLKPLAPFTHSHRTHASALCIFVISKRLYGDLWNRCWLLPTIMVSLQRMYPCHGCEVWSVKTSCATVLRTANSLGLGSSLVNSCYKRLDWIELVWIPNSETSKYQQIAQATWSINCRLRGMQKIALVFRDTSGIGVKQSVYATMLLATKRISRCICKVFSFQEF